MIVCVDTNVMVQFFGRTARYRGILDALSTGRLALALSNEIALEYQEILSQMAPITWAQIVRTLELMEALYHNIIHVESQFRFGIITVDPDDNKFCDCAIAANADFII